MKENKSKINSFMLFVFLLCSCFSFAACSQQKKMDRIDNREVQIVDFKTIEKEYLNYLSELNWPDGYSIPTKLEGEIAEHFQVGYGETKASMLWECVWEEEWLKYYKTDPLKANNAIEELEKAPKMVYMSSTICDDAIRKYFNDNLEKAKLGDPSGFEENIRLNSPE